MELVEKELKNVIYSQEKEKIDIKMKRKALEVIEEPQISFFRDLENVNNKENKSIINNLSNPEKNTIFSLTQSILNLKKNDLNQEQTSINKYILKKFSEYLMSIQRREAVESKLKNILDESSKLDKEISGIESKIRKNKEEITKFQSKIQLKNEKEAKKLMELENDLGNIIHEHGKADNQKKEIEIELNKNSHIANKKKEELDNLKKINSDLSEKINYLTKIIQYQTQLHTDIQDYKNQTNNEYQEAKGNVRVFCRIRPPLPKELTKKQINIEYRGDNSLIIKGEKKTSYIGRDGVHQDIEQFQFNRIFKQEDTQEEVFEEVSPLIQSSLDGFNINIFAYGQTGSGKTFTMEGDLSSPEKYGIVPRAVDKIFRVFVEELNGIGWDMKFFLSVCEIYNKKTRDLLAEKNVEKTEELKEMEIKSLKEWNENFGQIGQRRKVAETKMNMESSRSHLIFKIKIHLHNTKSQEDRFGSLNLIDLAGSERVDKSTVSEERFKESIEINSSLTHLKSVFEAMKSKHDKFVPFHNTPLTDVLKDCLSGDNSKTLMFVNISPLLDSFKESTCSLKFATDVNKCYVSDNNEDSEGEDLDLENKYYEPMDLDP
jgi:kinesin family protein C1